MKILRTPDSRFDGLPDWPFTPHYTDISDADTGHVLRVASVDEGPRDGRTVLLLHGEPSWSYLYRHVVPTLVSAGLRVVAPDLIGFGRSDKPADRHDYTYERHVAWLSDWFTTVNLQDVTLFCQDWGGLLGLRLVAAFPERFAGVVVANTGLPVGTPLSESFMQWLAFSQSTADLPIGQIVAGGTDRELTPAEVAAYDAPFPDASYKAGACAFPTLVPITPQHGSVAENKAAWEVLTQFNKRVVTAFSDNDPITRGGDTIFQDLIPGAKGQPHVTLKGAHFLQEDCPEEIAAVIEGVVRGRG
ncbi:haloalkane dehalogenase [Mycobacterium shigaense]|uniref:haloalkane dehalogenase n=1 Tax=Mycobacterium shigaense TaxID=722731 RepID=UPI002ADFB7AB|nr:haloalkane dehalogenase [Mycobacterium shigaense]MEA1122373.1 haloalkane dehalogenase [Mycobacterium shigaense]